MAFFDDELMGILLRIYSSAVAIFSNDPRMFMRTFTSSTEIPARLAHSRRAIVTCFVTADSDGGSFLMGSGRNVLTASFR